MNPTLLTGWVNGNLYLPTNEVSGVLPIPEDIREECAMAAFRPNLWPPKQQHRYLASVQGTRKAVLPVHNTAEKQLFRNLMANPTFASNLASAHRSNDAVALWNAHADITPEVSYKVHC